MCCGVEKRIKSNVSGNEVYDTNSLMLLFTHMLCRKLHCQKGFNLVPFSHKVGLAVVVWREAPQVVAWCVAGSGFRETKCVHVFHGSKPTWPPYTFCLGFRALGLGGKPAPGVWCEAPEVVAWCVAG